MKYLEWHMATHPLHRWELALLVGLACTLLWGLRLDVEQQALADQVIRLHVIANSDTQADQALKLLVRDDILTATQSAMETGATVEEVQALLSDQLEQLEQVAVNRVSEEGYSYSVTASLEEQVWFPTKTYETISLPAGQYTALRIVIGEGGGENWWCVVFPPLCLASVTEESDQPMEQFTQEQVSLITGETEGYVVKFKAMELWEEVQALLSNKQ